MFHHDDVRSALIPNWFTEVESADSGFYCLESAFGASVRN
jgi:hypothetical protein